MRSGDFRRTVRLFGRFTVGHRRAFGYALLLLTLDAVTAVAVPDLIRKLTDFLVAGKRPSLFGVAPSHDAAIPVIAAAIVLATAVNSSSESLADISLATAARTLGFNLRHALFAHLQRLPLAFHLRRGTGDVLTRLTGDVTAMEIFVEDSVGDVVGSGLILAATLAYLFRQSWQVALLAVAIVPLLTVVSNVFARRIKSASKQLRASEGELASTAQEMLSTISLVQVYGRADVEERKFQRQSRSARDAFLRTARLDAFFGFTVAVIESLGIAVVILLGARLVTSGSLSAGDLIAFILLIQNMFKPIRRIIKQWNRVAGVYASVERVGELLDLRPTAIDTPGARPAPPLRGEIEFRDVSFAYEPVTSDGQDGPPARLALQGVNFRVAPGESVALVGQSGAGKSTVAQLLPRLYDPHAGAVLIDGHDIRQFTFDSLRQQISMVLQETLLLRGTVAENIAYGREGATREDVITAARQAAAHDFVMGLPDGYDTVLGERAATLSGGQRQRLAVARAFIRNAPILILDEPTTGLDAESSALVAESLQTLTRSRSTLIVSHDLNLIRGVDRILVLSAGRILEEGSPADLLASGGLYAELYARQFGEAVAAAAAGPSRPGPSAGRAPQLPAGDGPHAPTRAFDKLLARAVPRPATREQFLALTGWIPTVAFPSPDDELDPLRSPALARRLPGLAAALDAGAMAPRLSAMLADGWELTACSPGKPVIEPGEGASVQFRLELRGPATGQRLERLVVGRAFPTVEAAERWRTSLAPLIESVAGRDDLRPYARPAVLERDLCLVLHAFPLDPAIPGLAVATDDALLVDLLGPVLSSSVPGLLLQGCHVDVARYAPGSCVLRYELAWRLERRNRSLKQVLYGKVYRDGRGRLVGPVVTALREPQAGRSASLPFLVPRFQAYLPDLRLALLEAVPGSPVLPELIRDRSDGAGTAEGPGLEEALAASARIATAVHRSSVPTAGTRTLSGELDDVRAAVRTLAPWAPALAAALDRHLQAVDGPASETPGRLGVVHGDFRPSQILFDGSTSGLVDFDTMCLGEQALDLGEFTAPLPTPAAQALHSADDPRGGADDPSAVFLRTYLRLSGGDPDDLLPRVAAYQTVALARLAIRRWCQLKPRQLRTALVRLEEQRLVSVR